uniref:Uncharacterized protein n=1 Tax=Arundo donax TaxID=35708 RepID=A0A0A9ESJ3_ARUDO
MDPVIPFLIFSPFLRLVASSKARQYATWLLLYSFQVPTGICCLLNSGI